MRVRVIVRGEVQGVSFRWSTVREAERLGGLVGWVRNLADGSVELEAEGARERVDALVAWCRKGPPSAVVDDLQVEETAPSGAETSFTIRR